MNHEELKEYIVISLEHSDMSDDEVWFSREAREAMLEELKKLERIALILLGESGDRQEIEDKVLAVIKGSVEE